MGDKKSGRGAAGKPSPRPARAAKGDVATAQRAPRVGAKERAEARAAVSGPARTCVACRQPGGRGELLRLVESASGGIAIDARARAAGRGAWVHPTRGCITAAAKRHAAERSLKVPVRADLDGEALVRETAAAFRRKALALIGSAQRKKLLAIGTAATGEALERARVPLILLATDAGEAAARAVGREEGENKAGAEGSARESGPRVRSLGTKSELGGTVGRGEVAVMAVVDQGIAAELMSTIDRLAGLEG